MKFVQQFIASEGGAVRFITGMERGRAAWYVVKLSPEHYHEYKKAMKLTALNLKSFGTIILSGWGKTPPEDVIEKIKKEYQLLA